MWDTDNKSLKYKFKNHKQKMQNKLPEKQKQKMKN